MSTDQMHIHKINERIKLVNADSLAYLKTVPSHSLDLVAVDPPYFRVKDLDWDNQWPDVTAYLDWLEMCVIEFARILKPNGSLYLFCSPGLNADIELLVRKHLKVLSHIVWSKPSGVWNRADKSTLRNFWPASERIIFAEQLDTHGMAQHSGYRQACQALRGQVMQPLIGYFQQAKAACGISSKEIDQAMGCQMAGHWFGRSQWSLPSEAQYARLQALFAKKADALCQPHHQLKEAYQGLHRTYQTLVASYDELKAEYEQLRRPFSVTKEVPFTDVWTYPSVQAYPGKHPCEKPAAMMEHIVRTSSRPGDVVGDFFMGSGATGKAAWRLGRCFIGVELETPRFSQTCQEFQTLVSQEEKHHAAQ
ncbi:DNA-methyltransferase [Aeromonas caviae]|uniref:DNA-methyltransferase n=1 Tax=Aeromonas caviae TaxID=648 RepID=UPI0038CFEDC9